MNIACVEDPGEVCSIAFEGEGSWTLQGDEEDKTKRTRCASDPKYPYHRATNKTWTCMERSYMFKNDRWGKQWNSLSYCPVILPNLLRESLTSCEMRDKPCHKRCWPATRNNYAIEISPLWSTRGFLARSLLSHQKTLIFPRRILTFWVDPPMEIS